MTEMYPGAWAGFRAMRLAFEGAGPPVMLSYSAMLQGASYEWKAGETNTAECGAGKPHPGQEVPVYDCKCGFWMYKTPKLLKQYLSVSGPMVYVLCAGWGKYVEHELALRVQHARPLVALTPLPEVGWSRVTGKPGKAERIVAKTGLPVVSVAELPRIIREYGLDTLVEEKAVTSPVRQWIDLDGSLHFRREDEHASSMTAQPLPYVKDHKENLYLARWYTRSPYSLSLAPEPEHRLMRQIVLRKVFYLGRNGEEYGFWLPEGIKTGSREEGEYAVEIEKLIRRNRKEIEKFRV